MEIVTYGKKSLREKSRLVEYINNDIQNLINTMVDIMHKAGGVGLAAPQIGINLRLFIIEIEKDKIRKVINPEILDYSLELEEKEEGCLSIPGIYQKVKRHKEIKVKFQNELGEIVIMKFNGIFARAFQHEYDHLEGVLFIDKISPLAKRLVKQKLKKLARKTTRI